MGCKICEEYLDENRMMQHGSWYTFHKVLHQMHRNVLEISRNLGRVCFLSQMNINHKPDYFRMSCTSFPLDLRNIWFRDRMIQICHIKCLFSANVFWYVLFDRTGRCMLCFSVSNAKRKDISLKIVCVSKYRL